MPALIDLLLSLGEAALAGKIANMGFTDALKLIVADKGADWFKDQISGRLQDTKSQLTEGGKSGAVTTTEWDKAMNDLANVVSSFGKPMDSEQMYNWFGSGVSNLIMNAQPSQIINLASSMKEFLSASNYIKDEAPNVADLFLNWVKDYVNRTMSLDRTISEISKLTDILNNRTQPKDSYVVAMLNKNYNLAGILNLMYNFSNPTQETFKQLSDLSMLSKEMLGPISEHLMNDKMLLSDKAKSNFSKLQASRAQFYLTTPAQMATERAKQWEQEHLKSLFGSDFAKAITDNPIFNGIWSFGVQGKWFLKNINSQSWGDIINEGSWK